MTHPTFATFAAIGDMGSGRVWAIVLGTLLAIVAISLLIASWTKWGQTKSLTKCIALAFLAHVWLLMYAYGTRIVTPGLGGGRQGGVRSESFALSVPIMMIEETTQPDASSPEDTSAHNRTTEDDGPAPAPWEAPLKRTTDLETNTDNQRVHDAPQVPELLTASVQRMPEIKSESHEPELPPIDSDEQITQLAAFPNQATPSPPPSSPPASSPPPPASPPKRRVDQQPVPVNYQMRMSPQRLQFASQNGGDVNTEVAVEQALAWLARAQGPLGGWNAAEHGAGRESSAAFNRTDGEYRHNAGLKANTAMTGLSLLAFLGAGHTHTDGQYKENVGSGLRYLIAQQLPSGDLSGREQIGREPTVRFARMYSHGMAALSLTEAYGMTGDPALLPAIQSACQYSLNAMNPRTGGWRYEFPTEDPGDLSQFGWQAMLLNSASNHRSFYVPPPSKLLMQRFLDSVSTGRHGGLAVYRPRSGQMPPPEQATPAMTAEAMASRLLLGYPLSPQAAEEGQSMLLRNLPGRSEENLYYWYYATLTMYQLRGDTNASTRSNTIESNTIEDKWNQWNDALKQQLCSTQVPHGPSQGSWNPTCLWGGYGGRVYSTAVACMCLEVYYRYLPMYKPEQFANQWQPSRR